MLFTSYSFLIFFSVLLALYWRLRGDYRKQNALLLLASYIFYGWWDVRFLFLLTLSTYIDYATTLMIARGRITARQQARSGAFLVGAGFLCGSCQWGAWQGGAAGLLAVLPASLSDWWITFFAVGFVAVFSAVRFLSQRLKISRPDRLFLFWSVLTNLAILGLFKYFNFFADNFVLLWQWLFGNAPSEVTVRIALPVGISFYTFQTMSHTIDVYRKQAPATDSLLDLASFVGFFPLLLSGPIERGARMLPQFQRARQPLSREEIHTSLWLIFWGLYKKLVIADNLSRVVDLVFGPYDLGNLTEAPDDGLRCLVAIYAFAIQIYCDFSGYTDMARGVARLLGFKVMLNFNLPYFAVNPSAFWQRWHISLSTWLRDYLYIPLGGNRGDKWATYRNLAITMLLGGLWHGAAWTFVLWGAFHGLILVIYRVLGDAKVGQASLTLKNVAKGVLMFHLVCFGWLLFRAHNLDTVGAFATAMVAFGSPSPETFELFREVLFYCWFLFAFQCIQAWTGRLEPLDKWNWFVRLNLWTFLILSLFRFAPRGSQQFIYFAF